jgi:hypothetical protein
VYVDAYSREFSRILTLESAVYNVIPAFGSALALSSESTISRPGANSVLATVGEETLRFTWDGDTFKSCVVDEIEQVEAGMIQLKVSGHEVRVDETAALFQVNQWSKRRRWQRPVSCSSRRWNRRRYRERSGNQSRCSVWE